MVANTRSPLTVLVVDDDAAVRVQLAAILDAHGHRVLEAHDAAWALELFERHDPDLVLLDVTMPEHDGFWLAKQLRQRESGKWTPIIFLSGRAKDEDLASGIESGGDDYLFKPISEVVLNAKLHAMRRLLVMQSRLLDLSAQLESSNQRLQHLSEHDELTGLLNRRGFDRRLAEALALARRNKSALTLILCDLDHFKPYNDALGHPAGDACLRAVGKMVKQICRRPGDFAARYGGEEFALLLDGVDAQSGHDACERIRVAIESRGWDDLIPGGSITISIGVTLHRTGELVDTMLARADAALYVAKNAGRNRVTFAD